MTDLIDRLIGWSEFMIPARPQITVHVFESHFTLFATGKWTAVDAQIGLDLQGDELTQATAIVNAMNAKNATQKISYGLSVRSIANELAHPPGFKPDGTPENSPNKYWSWSGSAWVIDRAQVLADLEIA